MIKETSKNLFAQTANAIHRNFSAMSAFSGHFDPFINKGNFDRQIIEMRRLYSSEYVDAYLHQQQYIDYVF